MTLPVIVTAWNPWTVNYIIAHEGQILYENFLNCRVGYYGFCPCSHASEEQGCQSKDSGRTGDNQYAETGKGHIHLKILGRKKL